MATGKGGRQAGRWPYSIVEALNRDWDELVHRNRGSMPCWSRPVSYTHLTLPTTPYV